ncbi:MAG: Tic20 family protein [Cyanobacteria bacterium J06634_6]
MNGSVSPADRAFAALSYVMPLTSALSAGFFFLTFLQNTAPAVATAFGLLLLPLTPFIMIESDQFLGLAVFVALFVFVVRNTNISRFIRYNVLQSILVSFVISVITLIVSETGILSIPTVGETLLNVLFLGGMAIVVYGVAQSVMGRYAEIPTISDAINTQLPY